METPSDENISAPAPENEVKVENVETPAIRRLRFAILTGIVPPAVMILLLLKDFFIVRGRMDAGAKSMFFSVIGLAAVSIAALAGYIVFKKRRKEDSVTLKSTIAFMMLFFIQTTASFFLIVNINVDVEPFILPPFRWLCRLMTFSMPGIAYFVIVLSGFIRTKKALTATAAALVGAPLSIYLAVHLMSHIHLMTSDSGRVLGNILLTIFIIFNAVCGLLFFIAVIKLILWASGKVLALRSARMILAAVTGFFLPLGGLLLNRVIPFPTDLQSPEVYILTLVNGAVLFFGVFNRKAVDLTLVFLKGAVLWFPLYFFLLFLPFQPLFVPAIIAFGTGFLILAPTLLFLFQCRCYIEDYGNITKCISKKTVITVFVLGAFLVPALFIAGAVRDRNEIERVAEYYFNSPYIADQAEQAENLDSAGIRRTLARLDRIKHGAETPYLDEIYSAIVFSGLTLSDAKISRICSDMCGENIGNVGRMFSRYSNPAGRGRGGLPGLDNRISSAVCTDVSAAPRAGENGSAVLTMNIKSKNEWNSEYVGYIDLPDGVFVDSLTLDIEGKTVQGRIFERKSAFWIYEKITVYKRDPALLAYVAPRRLRLMVFPVASVPRRVTIGLTYEVRNAWCEIDGKRIVLPENTESDAVLLSKAALSEFERPERKPEFVFVVNRSLDLKTVRSSLEKMFAGNPEIKSFRIASGIVGAGGLSRSYSVKDGLEEALLEYKGMYSPGTPGFAAGNVLKGALLRYAAEAGRGDSYPVLALAADRERPDSLMNLAYYMEFAPEYPVLTVINKYGSVARYSFDGMKQLENNGRIVKNEVRRLHDGRVVPLRDGVMEKALSSAPAALYADSLKLLFDPSKERIMLKDLVSESRRTGVLIPQSAYIVLETEAQWKTLENMEKTKLSKSSAFDIEEVRADEPEWFIFALLAGLMLFLKKLFAKAFRRKGAGI